MPHCLRLSARTNGVKMFRAPGKFSNVRRKLLAEECAEETDRPSVVPVDRKRHSGAKLKVVLYSHDTFGLGHLRRNLAIAGKLLDCDGRFSVRLLTGSPVIRDWHLPPGLRVQPLPPVVKTGTDLYAARDSTHMFGMV